MIAIERSVLTVTRCISCGCTNDHACMTASGACWWVLVSDGGAGLCSACANVEQRIVVMLPGPRAARGTTALELAHDLGLARQTVVNALQKLKRKGLAVRGGLRMRKGPLGHPQREWYRGELT